MEYQIWLGAGQPAKLKLGGLLAPIYPIVVLMISAVALEKAWIKERGEELFDGHGATYCPRCAALIEFNNIPDSHVINIVPPGSSIVCPQCGFGFSAAKFQ